jgi:hypothetical protein
MGSAPAFRAIFSFLKKKEKGFPLQSGLVMPFGISKQIQP